MSGNHLHIVIPARYSSSRLPGKPLKLIAGKTMIEHVYKQAEKSGIPSICVATDDQRIYDAVKHFGGRAIMTRSDHESGTDRLAEVCELEGWQDDHIVINLQGDEPLIPPEIITYLARIAETTDAWISTLAAPITSLKDIFNPNIVKVVLNGVGRAHYFSRAPIPWDRENYDFAKLDGDSPTPRYRHIGMYAYRVGMLKEIPKLPPCELEKIECLEQLRPLYNGIDIQVGIIDDAPEHGVDTLQDLQRVEEILSSGG